MYNTPRMTADNNTNRRGHTLAVYSDIDQITDGISKTPIRSANLFFRRFRLFGQDLSLTDADPNHPEAKGLAYRDDGTYQYDESTGEWKKIVNATKRISMADQRSTKK